MNQTLRLLIRFACLITLGFLATGCATSPYHYGLNKSAAPQVALPKGEPQIVRGEPNKILDAADWIWPDSLLGKLVLWNWKVDRHHISAETEAAIATYLERNNLTAVKVRLNQYDPGDEWKRLTTNTSVGIGWRYTLGAFATLGYTLLPGRILGGDNYNPYTNTINIYSDIPAIALHEAGHAKDSANKTYPGTYAAIYTIPLVPLWHESQATGDVIGYLKANNELAGEREAYHILYPAYGTYVGGSFAQFLGYPWNYAVQAGAVIPGHIIGRVKGAAVGKE